MDYENDEDNSDQSDYSSAVTDNYSEELERKFFYAITSCDIGTVNVVLQKKSYSDFDINCKNYQGMTGLNLAIQVNCESIVDLLIKQSGLEIGDSLMHAIRENFYSVVVKLLDILESKDPEKVKQGYEHSTEFPKHLTPLMLAAQCGHYTIIKLLLSRGHTIPIPHKPGCNCLEVSYINYLIIYIQFSLSFASETTKMYPNTYSLEIVIIQLFYLIRKRKGKISLEIPSPLKKFY